MWTTILCHYATQWDSQWEKENIAKTLEFLAIRLSQEHKWLGLWVFSLIMNSLPSNLSKSTIIQLILASKTIE